MVSISGRFNDVMWSVFEYLEKRYINLIPLLIFLLAEMQNY